MLVLRKFMGKKAAQAEEDYEDESLLSDSSASLTSRPRSGLARKATSEDLSPFTSLRSSHGKEALLPEDLRSDWVSLQAAFREVRFEEGIGVACEGLLGERMDFLGKLGDVLRKGTVRELPSGVVQITLITLRDQVNRVVSLFGAVPRTNEQLVDRTASVVSLLELVRFLVLHDTGPMLLNRDFLELYCRFYSRLTDQLPEKIISSLVELYYEATKTAFAIGEMVRYHEMHSQHQKSFLDQIVVTMAKGLKAIRTEPEFRALAVTQFLFFTRSRALAPAFDLLDVEHLDLHLALLRYFWELSKYLSLNLYETYGQLIIGSQLEVLHQCFEEFRIIDEIPSEAMCLLDKYLSVLMFALTAQQQDRKVAFRLMSSYGESLRLVTYEFCDYIVEWECPLLETSFIEDTGRLGRLFTLLMGLMEGLLGTQLEELPLGFFSDFEVKVLDGECKPQAGIQTYTLELLARYLRKTSLAQGYKLLFSSEIRNFLFTPAFLRQPQTRASNALCKQLDLDKHAYTYFMQLVDILQSEREGRNFIAVNFTENILKNYRNADYLTSVAAPFCILFTMESTDMIDFFAATDFILSLFELISQQNRDSIQASEALKVLTLHLLDIRQLAVSALKRPLVLSVLEQELVSGSDGGDFAVSGFARMLGTNEDVELFHRYVRMISEELNMDTLELLIQGIEIALKSEDPETTRKLFVRAKLLQTLIRKLEEIHTLNMALVVLPALKVVLHRCHAARLALQATGFSKLRQVLGSILADQAVCDNVESVLDNLLYIMFETADLSSVSRPKVPEMASILLHSLIQVRQDDIQMHYLGILEKCMRADSVNAWLLSKYEMLPYVLKFFVLKQTKEFKCKALELAQLLARENMSPGDVQVCIGLINDDTKASYPTEDTLGLLKLLKGAFMRENNIDMVPCSLISDQITAEKLIFPGKRGGSICLWARMNEISTLHLHLTNSETTDNLHITLSPKKHFTLRQCRSKAADYTATSYIVPSSKPWTLVICNFLVKGQCTELGLYINGQKCKVNEEGKPAMTKNAYDKISVNIELNSKVYLAGLHVFKRPLTETQVQELFQLGPAAVFPDYSLKPKCMSLDSKLRDSQAKLVLSISPLTTANELLVNAAVSPAILTPAKVTTIKRTHAAESFLLLGGVKLVWVLLERFASNAAVTEKLLEDVLTLTCQCLETSSEGYILDLTNGYLLEQLGCLLRKLSRKFKFDANIAALLVKLVDSLHWSTALQREAIEALLLNPKLWKGCDASVQNLVVTRQYSLLYHSKESKERLIAKLAAFCALDTISEEGGKEAIMTQKAAKLWKMELGSENIAEGVFKSLLASEYQHNYITETLLKYLSFIAKRGHLQLSHSSLLVLLHFLDEDNTSSTKITYMILRILKLTIFAVWEDREGLWRKAGKTIEVKFPELAGVDLFQLLDRCLHRSLTDNEYQALVSLMFFVPTLSPKPQKRSTHFPDVSCKNYFSKVIASDDGVEMLFPQVLDLLTKRITTNSSLFLLQDLTHIAKKHAEFFIERDNFPDWLMKIYTMPQKRDSTWSGLSAQLTATVFGQGLLTTSIALEALRRFLLYVVSIQLGNRDMCAPVIDLLSLILAYVSAQMDERTDVFVKNMYGLACLIEDFIFSPETRPLVLPHIEELAIKLVEMCKIHHLLACTSPRIPITPLGKLLEIYREPVESTPPVGRDGGLVRILLKGLFLALDAVPARCESVFLYLDFILEAQKAAIESSSSNISAQLFDSLPYVFPPTPKENDILASAKYLVILVFTEIVDILLRHENQKFLEAGLRYIKNLQTKYVLESLLESFLLEKQANEACEFESFQSEVANCGWAGLYQPTLLPPSQGHLSQIEFINVKEVIVLAALKAFKSALRGSLDALLMSFRSADWKLYIHPYLLARTVKVVSVIDRKLTPIAIERLVPYKFEPSLGERVNKVMSSMKDLIDKHRNSILSERQEGKHRRSYAKWLWRQFYKSQISTGLWALPKTLSPVFKLDPEFDLQLKSFRLKQVSNRSADYYLKKANKRTLKQAKPEADELRARHSVISRNCKTTPTIAPFKTVACDDPEESQLVPKEDLPEASTHVIVCTLMQDESGIVADSQELAEPVDEHSAVSHKWAFECERVQPKGACFGVIEISPTFFYFKSAGKKKPADSKYFGSALVFPI